MAATPAGTRSYFERMKAKGMQIPHGPLGSTELQVSRIGFGGYRLHEFDPDHREALRTALLNGCNLIDTSSNYTDGSSERLIGQVLSELFASGDLKREEIVVVTKAGYVQGETLKQARALAERGAGFSDMVEFQPDCWHCISPNFIETQISKSLERLKLDRLDVLLLHNPEYFLKTSQSRDGYYQRIEMSFRHLESETFKNRLQYFGVSSNTFPEDEARSDFTSLHRVLEVARAVAKPSHFAVIEFPFNLYESGAALSKNNLKETVFELAARENIGVLTNRPFNSFARGKLTRLTSFPKHDEVQIKGGLHTTLGRAIELEKLAPGYPKANTAFQWAHVLREKMGDFDDLISWRDALYLQIFPSIRGAIDRLSHERRDWADEYRTTMQELLNLITADLENLAHQKSRLIEDQLLTISPELAGPTSTNAAAPTSADPLLSEPVSLSQKLLRLYMSFPQISSVLVGMRTPKYVADILKTDGTAKSKLSQTRAVETLTRFLRYRS